MSITWSCTCLVLMLTTLHTVTAIHLSSQQMFFSKETGVVHQSSNSLTYPCSDGHCSVTDCTRACMQHHECVVYSHRSSDGQCILGGPVFSALSSFVVENAGWVTYKSECPVHAGYAEYDYQDGVVCLRFKQKKMIYDDAVSMCADHRASLAMVKDESFFQFLKERFQEMDFDRRTWVGAKKKPTGDYYWVDGTHLPVDDVMWKDAPSEEDCVAFRPLQDWRLFDDDCDWISSVICQFFP